MTRMPAWNGASESTGWIAPNFQNGWSNFGGTVADAAHRLDGNVVRLRGTVKSGTIGQPIFTLPSTRRPDAALQFAVPVGAGTGRLDIRANGEVVLGIGSTNTAVSLDGVTFISES